MSPVKNIGAFNHPLYGEYFLWCDTTDNTYGITRSTKSAPHCAYFSLAALFKAKGL